LKTTDLFVISVTVAFVSEKVRNLFNPVNLFSFSIFISIMALRTGDKLELLIVMNGNNCDVNEIWGGNPAKFIRKM
jgi:hypothetical protein